MNRVNKTHVKISKKASAALIKKYHDLGELCHIGGDVNNDSICYIPDGNDEVVLADAKAKKITITNRFPKGFYVEHEDGTIISNDNKTRLMKVDSETLDKADLKKLLKKIPEEYILTKEFIDSLGTKTALTAWMKARNLDVDAKLLKDELFDYVYKYYNLYEKEV